jgi:hypothetical protein
MRKKNIMRYVRSYPVCPVVVIPDALYEPQLDQASQSTPRGVAWQFQIARQSTQGQRAVAGMSDKDLDAGEQQLPKLPKRYARSMDPTRDPHAVHERLIELGSSSASGITTTGQTG